VHLSTPLWDSQSGVAGSVKVVVVLRELGALKTDP